MDFDDYMSEFLETHRHCDDRRAPPQPSPTPDDVPAPTHAPVEEPEPPVPPIKA
jgi:hypothetical protein